MTLGLEMSVFCRLCLCLMVGLLGWLVPSLALAQTFPVTGGDASNAINDGTFCADGTNQNGNGVVNNLEKIINVTRTTPITDVNLGLIASHTWRGDMRVTLVSPLGTSVILINPDTSGAGNDDDYNIELSDESPTPVNTGTHNVANDTSAAPYQFIVSPNNPLSAFDNENPNGDWTLQICDAFTGEVGTFISAELIFQGATGADLSLSASVDNAFPTVGDNVVLSYTVTSEGPQNSTPFAFLDLPPGLTFISATGDGSYDSSTEVWTIGSGLTPGVPRTIDITVSTAGVGSYNVIGEISASNRTDPDSTPNNGVTSEDDYAALFINVQPSAVAPALNCPATDQFELAFGAPGTANGWSAGNETESFTTFDPVNSANLVLDFEITGDTGFLGQLENLDTPFSQDEYTGGITPAEFSVGVSADFDTAAQFVTMEMDIGTPGVGIGAFQFTIFDVDLGGWVDRLQFRGFLNGARVSNPTVTPSSQNFVRIVPGTGGNPDAIEAVGRTGNAAQTSGAGNVIVTFNQPVDRVEWDYGNDASVGANPAFQIIAMHTIRMCGRRQADVSAVKTVEVFDPGNLGLYMTPGNEVLYKISVTNAATANAPAEDIDISDTLPTHLKFVSATTTGFTGGSFGSPALPAPNTDCAVTACVIRWSGADVPVGVTGEIEVRALIK